MAINQGICVSFIQEVFQAVHNFGPSPDTFKVALYTEAATLNSNTKVYTTTGEVVAAGYVAGGKLLTITQQPIISGQGVFINFGNLVWAWPNGISARGALIYNSSKSNRAVQVLDFGLTVQSNAAKGFPLTFPVAGPSTAIINAS